MEKKHSIVEQVYQSKEDIEAADRFISSYMPFIKSETAKFLNRPPVEGQDDELSIAMIAFHEAINGYEEERGAFLSYASMLIKNRLIDHWRSGQRHAHTMSIETPVNDADATLSDTLTDGVDPNDSRVIRAATRNEIKELSQQLLTFDVSLTDVAENSPRQSRTKEACLSALDVVKEHPDLLDTFLKTQRLPLKDLAKMADVPKKTLERHRKYLVALLVIYSNGYEIIRGHLSQLMRGKNIK